MTATFNELAMLLSGAGNDEHRHALSIDGSDVSEFFKGLRDSASNIETFAVAALLPFEEDDVPPLNPGTDEIAQRFEELLGLLATRPPIGSPVYHKMATSLWQEFSGPLQLWFFRQIAELSLDASDPETSKAASEISTQRLSAGDQATESDLGTPKIGQIRALKEIDEDEWLVWMLSRVVGRTFEEIAGMTSLDVGEVRQLHAIADAAVGQVEGGDASTEH